MSEYRKIRTRNNSVFGHFSRSDGLIKYLKSTTQEMKLFMKNFFSTSEQIRSNLRIPSYSPKKFFMENFIFCAVQLSELCFLGCILVGFISGETMKATHTITIRLTFLHRKMTFCHLILKGFYVTDLSSIILIMFVWLGFQI